MENRKHPISKWFVTDWKRWLLFGSVALGTFLRLYRLEENLVFHGELGDNYLAIKDFIAERTIPLLGPPTSHPWLSFGPLYYWIMTPIMLLGSFDPKAGAVFMSFVSALTIIVAYWVTRKVVNEHAAILCSYLLAISPAWIILAREARFYSLVALLFFPLLFFLTQAINEGKSASVNKRSSPNLFWTGVFLGTMLNFHLTPLTLIPAALLMLYLHRKKFEKGALFAGFAGFIFPNIPFLFGNIQTRFSMLIKFLVWMPYRLVGFLGFYPKNNVTAQIVGKNLSSLYDFFSTSYVTHSKALSLVLVGSVMLFVIGKTMQELKKRKKDWRWLTLVILLFFGYLGLFIHGDPPAHYYVALFPVPILFLSLLLDELLRKRNGAVLVFIMLLAMTVTNLRFYFSRKWFFLPQMGITSDGYVPYRLQLEAAKTILKTAKGEPFSLSRIGPSDQFEGNYAQNYQYLLWWLGSEPLKDANLRYTIYEDAKKLPQFHKGKVYWIGNLAVLRIEKQ